MAGWKSLSVCCALCGMVAGQANAGFISVSVPEADRGQGVVVPAERPAEIRTDASMPETAGFVSAMSEQADSEIARHANTLPRVQLGTMADTSHKAMKLTADDVMLLADITPSEGVAANSVLASAGLAAFLIGVVGIALKLVPELIQSPVRRMQQVA